MTVQINRSSRLNLGELKLIENVEFWDTLDLPVYVPGPSDLEYQLLAGDRLDNLAYRFYGDPVLWWVLAWANDIELPPIGMTPGTRIFVPDPEYIRTKLLNATIGI